MNTILGIDYGKTKIGLAIAPINSKLAVPYKVLRPASPRAAYREIADICKQEDVQEIVVGIPKSMMSQEELAGDIKSRQKTKEQIEAVRSFIIVLRQKTLLPIHEVDERLSTQEANKLLKGYSKDTEDAVAAMIILQSYLDHYADTISS